MIIWKLLFVNDGSKDDVSKFVQKYKDKILYIYKENGGPASARNAGINKATGKYIAFLDSDDLWSKEKLVKQVDFMEKTNAIWSHTNYSFFQDSNENKVYKEMKVSYFKGKVFPQCLLSNPIATPCVMIRNSYLQKNPYIRFPEEMRYGQDSFYVAKIGYRKIH